jgi:hypothetical protein
VTQIPQIVLLVLGPLAIGGTACLLLPILETAGLSFFRTNGLVFLWVGITGIAISEMPATVATLLLPRHAFFRLFLGVLLVYNLRLWFRHPIHSRPLLYTATILGVLALLTMARQTANGAAALVFHAVSLIVSGLLMGSGLLAMLLGHRYLTAPSLSIVPLDRLTQIFMGLIFLEAGVTAAGLFFLSRAGPLHDALLLRSFEGVYLWSRLLVGLAAPMVLAPMIRQTVAERSTMSATGLLYIAMLMIIIGAIFSRFFLLTRPGFS